MKNSQFFFVDFFIGMFLPILWAILAMVLSDLLVQHFIPKIQATQENQCLDSLSLVLNLLYGQSCVSYRISAYYSNKTTKSYLHHYLR